MKQWQAAHGKIYCEAAWNVNNHHAYYCQRHRRLSPAVGWVFRIIKPCKARNDDKDIANDCKNGKDNDHEEDQNNHRVCITRANRLVRIPHGKKETGNTGDGGGKTISYHNAACYF